MVMAQAPVARRAPIAEKYVAMRTQSFTRTHAKAMQEYLDNHPGANENDYYADFRDRVKRSQERYDRDVERIEADVATPAPDKVRMINGLARVFPAWTLEQEEAFVRTYGDPRATDSGNLSRLVEDLRDNVWANALREGEQRQVAKHPWEMKFYDALVKPQDGSIPLNAHKRSIATPIEDIPEQPVPVLSEDPIIQAKIAKLIKNTCPICKQTFELLTHTHRRKCAEDHAVESVEE